MSAYDRWLESPATDIPEGSELLGERVLITDLDVEATVTEAEEWHDVEADEEGYPSHSSGTTCTCVADDGTEHVREEHDLTILR